MPKAELTKTIEARKLAKRTMRAISSDPVTIPFGGILDEISMDDYVMRFHYLGEPYEADLIRVQSAYRLIEQ